MEQKNKKSMRRTKRGQEAALKLVVLGLVLFLLPAVLGHSALASTLASLQPLAIFALLTGCVWFWWQQDKDPKESRLFSDIQELIKPPTQPLDTPLRDTLAENKSRTERELERMAELSNEAARRLKPQPPPQVTQSQPAWSASVFDEIEWRRFEAVMERLFEYGEFHTKSQSHGADGGVDIWLYSREEAGKLLSLVQCKHWKNRRVGVDKIRELRGVMAAHGVTRGQFATTSTFTPDAIDFAQKNGIHLLDASGLLQLIALCTPEQQAELLGVARQGEYWRPTCVNCGIKLVERQPRNGGMKFWGCPTFPKCKTTMPMRQQVAHKPAGMNGRL